LLNGCFLLIVLTCKAQDETYLQPFSALLINNPSFAGFDKKTNFYTGNQHYHLSEDDSYNLFFTTYDTYSEKLKGGVGINLQHGIIGKNNISTSEFGFSYSLPIKINKTNQIILSARSGVMLATKQWYTYVVDRLFIKGNEPVSAPGKKFTRYYLIKPGMGFLCDFNSFIWGASAIVPLKFKLSNDESEGYQQSEQLPLSVSFYLSKKNNGNHNGIKSSPFETIPELIIFYNEAFFTSRASYEINYTNRSYGAFLQSDFTNQVHCFGGSIGYSRGYMNIKFDAGVGLPGISEYTGVVAELSVGISIPPEYYSRIKPWAPRTQ